MARARKTKIEATPVVEASVVEAAPVVQLSWMDRMLLSENGRKLARPMDDNEKRTATSAVLTGAAMALTGPVAGAIAAVGVTAINSSSTKENWQGVGSAACGGIALAAAGVGSLAAAAGGLVTTGIGMIANRLRAKE